MDPNEKQKQEGGLYTTTVISFVSFLPWSTMIIGILLVELNIGYKLFLFESYSHKLKIENLS